MKIAKSTFGARGLLLIATLVLGTSCARMGMTQKMATIATTAGLGGAGVSAYGQVESGAAIASAALGGLLAGGSTSLVHVAHATPDQERRARSNGERIYSEMSEKKKAKLKKKGIRYLAVDTRKNENSRGARVVMMYDLEEKKVQSKTYEVRFQPEIGQKMKFGTMVSEYIGGSGAADEIARPDGSENLR